MSKKSGKGTLWTSEEDEILKGVYPISGAKGVVRRLGEKGFIRSKDAVKNRVKKLKIEFKGSGGKKRMPLVHAYPRERSREMGCQAHPDIIAAAKEDGVLTRSKAYPYTYLAPIEWVDEYMRKLDEERTADWEASQFWLSTKEVAKLFGFTSRSFSVLAAPSAMRAKKYKLHDYLERIPQRVTNRQLAGEGRFGRFWKPEEAHREAELYHVRRMKRRTRRNGKP